MRFASSVLCLLGALALAACGARAPSGEPESLVLARRMVEEVGGQEHRAKMRVVWPATQDETPPDGAEVVIVRGYTSYEVTRLVLRGTRVEAGSVHAGRSWFQNRQGESFEADEFDVPAEKFVIAWNAMRRLLAASDERIAPEPDDHPQEISSCYSSHASADWIRARPRMEEPPLHCADQPSQSYEWDKVRMWEGLRDQAIFETFEALLPNPDEERRPVPIARWSPFAAEQVRDSSSGLDLESLGRDRELLHACLRVLGEAGDTSDEADVAALAAALADLDASDYWVKSTREEASRAATRLRLRLDWNRDDVVRTLRSLPNGTWANEDLGKWMRERFRTEDPAGWAEFLLEEATRPDARAEDVAAAAAGLRDLSADRAIPILHALLTREDPYIRLQAALTLHDLAPEDARAGAAIVALALDRTIACDCRPDLVDRWSRNRALTAALEWGGLSPASLRAHLLAPEVERPEFLAEARSLLANTPEALSDAMAEDCWSRILERGVPSDVVAAVRHLMRGDHVVSNARLLSALDRMAEAGGLDRDDIGSLRAQVEELGAPAGGEK